jgi:hypothetical protein
MSALLLTVMTLTGLSQDAQQTTGVDQQQSVPVATEAAAKKPQELRDAIRAAMRREAKAADPSERADAVRELAGLFVEVRRDTQLAQDEQKRLHALLWSRLTRIKKQLQAKIDRERRAAKRERAKTASDDALLAAEADQQLAAVVGQQFSLASQLTGGPAAVVVRSGEAFGGRAGPADYGEELVELIEKTIAPETWESAGGPGSIYYFYPLKVLVIRQTDGVHGHAADLLDGLRRAGP